jgi:hypothetical protein
MILKLLIKKRIVPFTYALRRARKIITNKTATDLYYAYVQSHFVYMSAVWAGLSGGLMKSLEVLQRKALRIVNKKGWFAGKEVLYSIRFLPVSVMCQVNSCLLIFKIISNLIKNNVSILSQGDVHSHSTRNRGNFVVRQCRTVLGAQNFYIRAFNLYNSLPQQIKSYHSLNIVKNRLREHFYEAYWSVN